MSQAELARRVKIPAPTVALIEAATRLPSAANLVRFADALDVSVDYLLNRTDEPGGRVESGGELGRHLSQMDDRDVETVMRFAADLVRQRREERKA